MEYAVEFDGPEGDLDDDAALDAAGDADLPPGIDAGATDRPDEPGDPGVRTPAAGTANGSLR